MTNERYAELLEGARDALHDLLKAAEPGTGFHVQKAYNTIKKQLTEYQPAKREPVVREGNVIRLPVAIANRAGSMKGTGSPPV